MVQRRNVDDAEHESFHAERLRAAVRSIPPRFRWVDPTSRNGYETLVKRSPIWPHLRDLGRLVAESRVHTVTFIGAAGSGRTSAAIGLMRRLLDSASWSALCRVSRSEAATRTLRAVGARFVTTRALCPPAESQERPLLVEARGAMFLVLDDVGEEAGSDTWRASERVHHTMTLIKDFHDAADRTLIATMIHTDDRSVASIYGDGVARRLFGWQRDDGVVVVDCDELKVYTART